MKGTNIYHSLIISLTSISSLINIYLYLLHPGCHPPRHLGAIFLLPYPHSYFIPGHESWLPPRSGVDSLLS
jgi:hypothetical protein